MKKIAIVYWSGTGNTEAMASAVKDGATNAGAEAVVLTPSEFDVSMLTALDAVAFGCPAMGSEVLEEEEFQPMWDSCKTRLGGKAVVLFGSYGWGDGEWMRAWERDCDNCGVTRAYESVTCGDAPDDTIKEVCRQLGAALAK